MGTSSFTFGYDFLYIGLKRFQLFFNLCILGILVFVVELIATGVVVVIELVLQLLQQIVAQLLLGRLRLLLDRDRNWWRRNRCLF